MTFCDIDYPSVPILAVLPVSTSLCIYLCICSMSTINLQCNFHCRSLPLLLFISLLPFYPHPRASAFEEIQFEILSCIFQEPNLFFFFIYPVLCCCCKRCFIDIAWERPWWYWSVSTDLRASTCKQFAP